MADLLVATGITYLVTKIAATEIVREDGETYNQAKERIPDILKVDEVVLGAAADVAFDGADLVSGDLQLGTLAREKIGKGVEWLDDNTGGNAGLIFDGLGVVGGIGAAGKAGKAASTAGKAASKVDDVAATASKVIKVGSVDGVENTLTVTGYTKHGINQAISREGVGTKASSINDAIRNPIKITEDTARNSIRIQGAEATVIINNQTGKVITTYGKPRN